ncbi:hypothetical protein [Actinopolymorpha cephalotaxi]|uniref:Uncharacterized protein n=1 Tax=Actinopolymorpha cephalotaxi TaxID=504797 RepID=A0ABX2S264_9ACTN|nr:hypothetical protein [Actinopolymorpha cephalotaxi]NYH83389.1 hypothetical protein [Actinopolymorpha cephalotaxi]
MDATAFEREDALVLARLEFALAEVVVAVGRVLLVQLDPGVAGELESLVDPLALALLDADRPTDLLALDVDRDLVLAEEILLVLGMQRAQPQRAAGPGENLRS